MGCFHPLQFALVKITKVDFIFFFFFSLVLMVDLPLSGFQLLQALKIPEQISLQIFL